MDISVRDSILAIGVPLDAVVIEEMPRPGPASTLRSKIWPTPGGMQISRNLFHSCTLSYTVTVGWTYSFLTNSHCTSQMFANDGSVFFQPTAWTWNKMGQEFWDPTGTPCAWDPELICRRSDAAAVSYGYGGSGAGGIARTGGWGGGDISVVGSFEIVGQKPHPDLGDIVDKVGRTTGWTFGVVNHIAWTATIDGYPSIRLLGQVRVENYSWNTPFAQPGDSGSPVFIWTGSSAVHSTGMLWGITDGGETAFFSSLHGIQSDFLGQIFGWWW